MDFPSADLTLEQRERRLIAREREVARRERELSAGAARGINFGRGPPPNWPKCFPVVFLDIRNEIPAGCQRLARSAYRNTYARLIGYAAILVGMVLFMFKTEYVSSAAYGLVSIVLYCALGFPLFFIFTFYFLYTGLRDGKARNLLLSFSTVAVTALIDLFYASGLTSPGLISMIAAFSDGNVFYGVVGLACCAIFVFLIVMDVRMFTLSLKKWRELGGKGSARRDKKKAAAAVQYAQYAAEQPHAAGLLTAPPPPPAP